MPTFHFLPLKPSRFAVTIHPLSLGPCPFRADGASDKSGPGIGTQAAEKRGLTSVFVRLRQVPFEMSQQDEIDGPAIVRPRQVVTATMSVLLAAGEKVNYEAVQIRRSAVHLLQIFHL